jgi:hypothetical protein
VFQVRIDRVRHGPRAARAHRRDGLPDFRGLEDTIAVAVIPSIHPAAWRERITVREVFERQPVRVSA